VKVTSLSAEFDLALEDYRQAHVAWKEALAREDRDRVRYGALLNEQEQAKQAFIEQGTIETCEVFSRAVATASDFYIQMQKHWVSYAFLKKETEAKNRFWDLAAKELTPFVDG